MIFIKNNLPIYNTNCFIFLFKMYTIRFPWNNNTVAEKGLRDGKSHRRVVSLPLLYGFFSLIIIALFI